MFSHVRMPRCLTRVSPGKIDLMTIFMKERRKRIRYLGSFWHHQQDRHWMYDLLGQDPNGSKLVLHRTLNTKQYFHPTHMQGTWQLRQIKMKGTQYDLPGGLIRNKYDDTSYSSSHLTYNFKKFFKKMDKNYAIEILEQWGLKFVVLDETIRPSVVECMYWKHKLYSHNFPWIRDPVMNARHGDPDYSWKETDVYKKFDYSTYGATTPHPRNSFTTLWEKAVAESKSSDAVPSILAHENVARPPEIRSSKRKTPPPPPGGTAAPAAITAAGASKAT